MGAKSGARGVLPPIPFENVAIPVLPAHDRASLDGVQVRCLPAYSPFPIGRKAEIVARLIAEGKMKL